MVLNIKIKRAVVVASALFFCMNSIGVSANEIETAKTTVFNNVIDIEEVEIKDFSDISEIYDNKDGRYVEVIDDNLSMHYEIESGIENVKKNEFSTNSTTYSKSKTMSSTLTDKNNKIVWKSTLSAKFSYDGKYVWCTSGVTYFDTDLSSTRVLTKNVYSSKKVTGLSYYEVNSTISTSNYGTYYLREFISCNKDGDFDTDSRYSR